MAGGWGYAGKRTDWKKRTNLLFWRGEGALGGGGEFHIKDLPDDVFEVACGKGA